jgi:hypothetical protein
VPRHPQNWPACAAAGVVPEVVSLEAAWRQNSAPGVHFEHLLATQPTSTFHRIPLPTARQGFSGKSSGVSQREACPNEADHERNDVGQRQGQGLAAILGSTRRACRRVGTLSPTRHAGYSDRRMVAPMTDAVTGRLKWLRLEALALIVQRLCLGSGSGMTRFRGSFAHFRPVGIHENPTPKKCRLFEETPRSSSLLLQQKTSG